jgi:hypothetical protein
MNLHGIVSPAIGTVNPQRLIPYYASAGYTQNAAFKQVPAYADAINIQAQIQALTGKDLRHEALQNIQGLFRGVYIYGNKQGVDRVEAKGGDMFWFAEVPGGTARLWKVLAVLETWPDWSKVAVVLQLDTVPPGPLPT